MLAWVFRGLLIVGAIAVVVLMLGSRSSAEQPQPTAALAVVVERVATLPPTVQPTATSARFIERITSRIARDTPAPYPTSTPAPDGLAFVNVVDFGYMPSVTRIHVGQTVVW